MRLVHAAKKKLFKLPCLEKGIRSVTTFMIFLRYIAINVLLKIQKSVSDIQWSNANEKNK